MTANEHPILDILWLTLSGVLVLLMQAGFLCLESGVTRSKNAINVAMKNAADFVVAVFLFWLVGFGLMFGTGFQGFIGTDSFLLPVGQGSGWQASFFLFQAMFCATAVTIVSGAVAERTRFGGYIAISVLISTLIYPVTGHWAWAGAYGNAHGWLAEKGFVDFAGSTVVHSVGGWAALAALLVIGPRRGRFVDGRVQPIVGSNAPLALLGVLFFVIGWIGFNGGSALTYDEAVPGIIANTILAAVTGAMTVYLLCDRFRGLCVDTLMLPLNGALAGLVSITAGCHSVTAMEAVLIGAIGAVVMVLVDYGMIRRGLDDAIGAVPVHLGAGIWGTLAVALFGDPEILGTGLDAFGQLQAQLFGIVMIGGWAFLLSLLFIFLYNRFKPLRVSPEDEQIGLNISEHGARTDLIDLLSAMDNQERSADLSCRMPVEPFTEVGQIAARYNRVMDALEQALMQTQAIVRDIRDGIVTFSRDGMLTSFNPGAEKVFGLSAATAIGQPVGTLFHARYGLESPNDGIPLDHPRELLGRRNDDTPFHIEVTVTQSDYRGEPQYTALIRDVDEKRRIEEQLFQEKERALVTLSSIADGVVTTDAQGRVSYLNAAGERLTGWTQGQAMGRMFTEIYRCTDKLSGDVNQKLIRQVLRGQTVIAESQNLTLTAKDGSDYAVTHTAAPIKDRSGGVMGAVVVFHDVTTAHAMQQQLSHQATHDALTGLLNRTAFEAAAGEMISHVRLEGGQHVLGYLDLDQFKLVNDTCGHVAGDELLRQISSLIQGQLRSGDTVARLGGDEFGILMRHCDTDHGYRIAEAIRQVVHDFRFSWDDKQFSVGVSVGLVSISQDTESLPQLLSVADAACYAAKDMGRNRVHIFNPDDTEVARRRGQMQWVGRIRDALDRDRLRLYFQPISPTQDVASAPGHFEIFVRMIDDEDNIIPPGAFIPAAERYNLIQEIDLWVIKNALAWLGDHHRRQGEGIKLCALNLSGASLGDKGCLAQIRHFIAHYRVPPEQICFEITETAAIANLGAATRFMSELKAIGCKFALDDFGSGLSSFGYLKNLQVDYLKIDGAFIKDIEVDPMDSVMVQSINTIGHEMGLQTIAEFVESQAILEHLREIGVDFVQGYHVGRPRPLEQLEGVFFMPR